LKVCFLLKDLQLAGGVGMVVSHAENLARHHGFDVAIVLTGADRDAQEWHHRPHESIRLLSVDDVDEHFDVAVATWWETVYPLFGIDAKRHAYFVQSLEDRFYPKAGDPERLGAATTHELPAAVITEARWIADTLEQLRPGLRCYYVRNGIDKRVFSSPEHVTPRTDEPLRILVEGHPDVPMKAVGEAAGAAAHMRERHTTTLVSPDDFRTPMDVDRIVGSLRPDEMAELYRETDVLLKLSRVEGMFGPPLEAFHLGATCVVTGVTGHEEYVIHGWNGVVVDWDDPTGTARWLDLLAVNRPYLHFLRHNALLTARSWPSSQQSSHFMAAALKQILRDDPPKAGPGLFANVLAASWDYRRRLLAAESELEQRRSWVGRLTSGRAYRNPLVRVLLSPARLAYRAARRIRGGARTPKGSLKSRVTESSVYGTPVGRALLAPARLAYRAVRRIGSRR
jgi:glycosyltransferase involved in cell wall biosynthesis